MGEPVILEVLDRRQRVAQRQRLDALPLTIGRAPDCDLHLDDPYVCPRHARVVRDADGRLVLEDLGSVNGSYALAPERRVARIALDDVDALRLGRTTLRLRRAGAPLPATLIDRDDAPPAHRPLRLLALCAAALALVGADAYLGSYAPQAARDALAEAVIVLLLAFGWATAWGFVNRVLAHQWNLLGHLAVACGFVVGVLALDAVFAYAGFLVSAPRLIEGAETVAVVLLLAALLSGHLALVSPAPAIRRRLTALGSAALFVGVLEVVPGLFDDGFSVELSFGSALRPVPHRWLPTRSLDDFVAGLDAVRETVDRQAAQPL